jgi:hypothetical protein
MVAIYKNILEMGSERAVANLAVKALEDNPESLRDILDLCFIEKYPLSMRAARVVQLYCEKYPGAIYPFLDEVVEKTTRSNIGGVRRNFLKIFADFIEIKKINDPGPLLNTCFEWILDRTVTPAIKIHAMGVIFKSGLYEPALLQELAASIEIIMDESEISMKNCGRKMLKKISQQSAVSSQQSAVSGQRSAVGRMTNNQ